MNRPLLPLIIAALLLPLGCGGNNDDATGVDQIPNIDGSWTYTNTWSGGGLSCSYAPSSLTIDQTGGTFTGRLETSDATCAFLDKPSFSLGSFGNPIVNGTVNAAGDVTFDLLDENGHHTGRVSGNSMSGSLMITGDLFETGNPVTYPGTWVASR